MEKTHKTSSNTKEKRFDWKRFWTYRTNGYEDTIVKRLKAFNKLCLLRRAMLCCSYCNKAKTNILQAFPITLGTFEFMYCDWTCLIPCDGKKCATLRCSTTRNSIEMIILNFTTQQFNTDLHQLRNVVQKHLLNFWIFNEFKWNTNNKIYRIKIERFTEVFPEANSANQL